MSHLISTLSGMLLNYSRSSLLANDLVSNTLRTTITCNTCHCLAAKEEKCDILPLPVSNNIKTSLDKLLDSETTLSSQNKWFCPSFDTLTESTKEMSITNSSSVLIVQLTRFSIRDNRAIKDKRIFDCFPNSVLKVPITLDNKVSFTNK